MKNNPETPAEPSSRVWVAVSKEMEELRLAQRKLNNFLWSTAVAYAYFLDNSENKFGDLDRPAHMVLKHLNIDAWHVNDQGRLKMNDSLRDVIQHTRANYIYAHKSALIYFLSAFEQFLNARVTPWFETNAFDRLRTSYDGWGPYYETLAGLGKKTVPVGTLVRADICRQIRNKYAHANAEIPKELNDTVAMQWKGKVIRDMRTLRGTRGFFKDQCPTWFVMNREVEEAFTTVIGNAAIQVKANAASNKPIELFYTLFTFTNLDTLAFQIEEALIGSGSLPLGRISRKESEIERDDLIVDDGPASDLSGTGVDIK